MATRRDALKSLAAMAVGSTLGANGAAASTMPAAKKEASGNGKQPNILLFLTDDHGRWLQQAYGNSEVKTPNMTRIAERGVRMLNAHTPCPVCSPARASFFTGRMPSQHGIHDYIAEKIKSCYSLPWLKGQTLISELLKGAGYHTALVGKWHCGQTRDPHPGFDKWFSYWLSQYPHYGEQNFSDNGKHVTESGFQSPFLTDQAIAFLKDHYSNAKTKESPFFLFVGYVDTHSPHIQMPEELVSEYDNATFRDIHKEKFRPCHGVALTGVSKNPKVERSKLQEYYAAASSVDREVGRVLDALETMGEDELENTIIIYTTDHGLNAEQHGIWEKGNATVPQNFFEESIMIAQAFSWPKGGIPAGLALDIPVDHCDLFQTLLDAAGATPDEATARKINSPGNSYLAHLRGNNEMPWHKEVICEYGNARMMKQDGYKLILRYPYAGIQFENELYDLKADPQENVNIYQQPEHANRIACMTKAIEEFFKVYTVPGHSGLELEKQPMATPLSPWLHAVHMQKRNELPEDLLVKPKVGASA